MHSIRFSSLFGSGPEYVLIEDRQKTVKEGM